LKARFFRSNKMAGIIDMKLMRYINLFERVARVSTTNCFVYNNVIIFAVPKELVSKAVGKDGINVRRLGETLRRKIKVIAIANPEDDEGMKKFISDIVSPIEFNKVEIKDNQVTINAGRQSKAALIGRGRQREKELNDILKNYFKIQKLRIG
jgi:NusA-like KH domain protein